MALNIKNEEAHRLAKELAEATGETLTDAVTSALRHRVRSEVECETKNEALLLAEVEDIQRLIAALPDRDTGASAKVWAIPGS